MADGRLRAGSDALDIFDCRSGVNWGCGGGDVRLRLQRRAAAGHHRWHGSDRYSLARAKVSTSQSASGSSCAEGRSKAEGPSRRGCSIRACGRIQGPAWEHFPATEGASDDISVERRTGDTVAGAGSWDDCCVRSRSASDQRPLHAAPTVRAVQCQRKTGTQLSCALRCAPTGRHGTAWDGLESGPTVSHTMPCAGAVEKRRALSQRGGHSRPAQCGRGQRGAACANLRCVRCGLCLLRLRSFLRSPIGVRARAPAQMEAASGDVLCKRGGSIVDGLCARRCSGSGPDGAIR